MTMGLDIHYPLGLVHPVRELRYLQFLQICGVKDYFIAERTDVIVPLIMRSGSVSKFDLEGLVEVVSSPHDSTKVHVHSSFEY